MGRRARRDPNICPSCGAKAEKPIKTWQLVSPLPDAYGRITITVMGSYRCESCGHSWRAVVSKIKVGGEDVEIEGVKGVSKFTSKKPVARREGEIIEVDIDEE